jgi:hypothetical protein
MALYYVAHRLFAAHDRALGALAAGRLADKVGAGSVFLPFCDTNEEDLVDECKGQRLFEMDCERLKRIDGMIAILHGPSLDDGVCMEIGFAVARGLPVVILTTDFQSYGPTADDRKFVFPEPLLEMHAINVERCHRLAPESQRQDENRFSAFRKRNMRPLDAAIDRAVDSLLTAQPRPLSNRRSARLAYLEPSPYLPHHQWCNLAGHLRETGWDVHLAARLHTQADIRSATRVDWDAFCQSALAIVDARGPETAPGAALLTGASAVVGRPVLAAYAPGWLTWADGREPNWRNLMIQYALSGRFASIGELIAITDALQ